MLGSVDQGGQGAMTYQSGKAAWRRCQHDLSHRFGVPRLFPWKEQWEWRGWLIDEAISFPWEQETPYFQCWWLPEFLLPPSPQTSPERTTQAQERVPKSLDLHGIWFPLFPFKNNIYLVKIFQAFSYVGYILSIYIAIYFYKNRNICCFFFERNLVFFSHNTA